MFEPAKPTESAVVRDLRARHRLGDWVARDRLIAQTFHRIRGLAGHRFRRRNLASGRPLSRWLDVDDVVAEACLSLRRSLDRDVAICDDRHYYHLAALHIGWAMGELARRHRHLAADHDSRGVGEADVRPGVGPPVEPEGGGDGLDLWGRREDVKRALRDAPKPGEREVVRLTRVSEEVLLDQPGLKPERSELLDDARAFLERVAAARPRDLDARSALARAQFRLAILEGELSGRPAALERQARALADFDALVAERPDRADFVRQRAACLHNLALSLEEMGRPREARSSVDAAIAAWESIPGEGTAVEDRRDLAEARITRAIALGAMGDLAGAEADRRRSLAIREGLLRERPGDPADRSGLASALVAASRSDRAAGRAAEAGSALDRAPAIRRKLVEEDPGSTRHRRDLAATLADRGEFDLKAGRPRPPIAGRRARLPGRREALGRAGRGTPGRPPLPGPARDRPLQPGQNLLAARGDRPGAERAFRAALALGEALSGQHRDVVEYRVLVASACNNLANLIAPSGGPDRAIEWLARAEAARREIAGLQPGSAEARHQWAICLNNLGNRLGDAGRLAPARRRLEQARELWRGLAGAPPGHPAFARLAAIAAVNLARVVARATPPEPEAVRALLREAAASGLLREPAIFEELRDDPRMGPFLDPDEAPGPVDPRQGPPPGPPRLNAGGGRPGSGRGWTATGHSRRGSGRRTGGAPRSRTGGRGR